MNLSVRFRVCGSYIKKYTSEQQHWTAESARHAQERISSVRTVRAFGHDRLENEKYSSLVRKVQEMTEKEARAQSQGSTDLNWSFPELQIQPKTLCGFLVVAPKTFSGLVVF